MTTSPAQTQAKAAARRQFMLETTTRVCGMGAIGLGLGMLSQQARALPPGAIRPPGAGPESDFQSACIRCGLCVRDCPYDILHLATPGQTVATGTPFFVARSKRARCARTFPASRPALLARSIMP